MMVKTRDGKNAMRRKRWSLAISNGSTGFAAGTGMPDADTGSPLLTQLMETLRAFRAST